MRYTGPRNAGPAQHNGYFFFASDVMFDLVSDMPTFFFIPVVAESWDMGEMWSLLA